MGRIRRAALCAAMVLALAGCAGVPKDAADDSQIPLDQKLLPLLDQERGKPNGKGLVLLGVTEAGGASCYPGTADIGQFVDGKFQPIGPFTAWQIVPFSGGQIRRFEPHALPAGEYVIGTVSCAKKSFTGPHAKFAVKAGEFVDVGVLTFQTKQDFGDMLIGRGALLRTVGPSDQKHVAKLKEAAPGLMAKLVHRPMVIPGPEEVRMTVRQRYQSYSVPVMVRRR